MPLPNSETWTKSALESAWYYCVILVNTSCHISQWINKWHTISSSINQVYACDLYVDFGRKKQSANHLHSVCNILPG